jgi:tetratricopeptide (TPR) repeat protein
MNAELIRLLETGYAAQQGGDLDSAESNYRRVLASDPGNEFALNLLGVVLLRRRHFEEALGFLRSAAQANPADPDTHNNLGLALSGLHRYEEAIAAFQRSLQGNGRQPQALNNLGNALAAMDRHSEALQSFERALALQPAFADCLHNLAVSLLATERSKAALKAIGEAVRLEPGRSPFLNTRAEILMREARYDEAHTCLQDAIAIDGSLQARINLSTVLKQQGRYRDAVDTLEDVLREAPSHAEAHHHLGVLHEQLGDSGAAAAAFRRAIAHNPRHASAYYQLSKLRNERLTPAEQQAIQSLLVDSGYLELLRPPLLFALGCEAEKDRDYAASMALFKQAQAIKARRNPYDHRAAEAFREACERVFPLAHTPPIAPQQDDPVPVFVIGMPRSGTTLTEQILTSHSEISGAGEVGFVNRLVERLTASSGAPYPDCAAALDARRATGLRQWYFSHMRQRCGDAAYVVDKNPLNYNFVGFIATLFPEARIVYCRRNPADNCVSIFRLPFDDNQGYSHDLAALGHCYRAHTALMQLWESHYAANILTLDYEHTVEDLQGSAQRMADFLGLPLEASMLRFFDNQRAVLTPSAEQVRQGLYSTSVGMWRRYGDAISPLLEALDIDSADSEARH